MTILIANIGTSDLAVKIDGYYIPVFERNEPNIEEEEAKLTGELKEQWNKRRQTIRDFCADEFKMNFEHYTVNGRKKFPFREITKTILKEYNKKTDEWHDRLCFARIMGVIKEAKQRGVKKIYVFITSQPHKIKDFKNEIKDNDNFSDSLYLFGLLKKWCQKETELKDLSLKPINVTQKGTLAIDFDRLLNQYYQFFVELDEEEKKKVFISIKGGTPQMQTALRVQAIASGISNQVYLDPELSIVSLMQEGQYSECREVSYWRYQRLQKYQAVKQLLERWDFDGARTLLEEWEKTLHSFSENLELGSDPDLLSSQEIIEALVKALNIAVGYFNLDPIFAKNNCDSEQLRDLKPIVDNYPHRSGENNKHYPKLLNLYTQCCIFWNTDRIADFLARTGSFYEETLHELIYAFEGDKYFVEPRRLGTWSLRTKKLLTENNLLAQEFYELEKKAGNNSLVNKLKKRRCINDQRWTEALNDPRTGDEFELPGRPTKVNFVRALIKTNESLKQKESVFDKMLKSLKNLDYWYIKRNQLIHSAKGISKQRMAEVLGEDIEFASKPHPKGTAINYDSVKQASEPNNILKTMAAVNRFTLELMGTSSHEQPNYLDPENEPYYIYSDIRDWVRQTLDNDCESD